MASPTSSVSVGGGAFGSAANGVDALPGQTVVIQLDSSADVGAWSCVCLTTDDSQSAATINAGLVSDGVNRKVTFTMPASKGVALRFIVSVTSLANAAVVSTTTLCIYSLTDEGNRVVAADETLESGAFGWGKTLNKAIRNTARKTARNDIAASGVQDSVATAGYGWLKWTSGTASTLNGLANGYDGKTVLLTADAAAITIANQASAVTSDRIITGTGANFALASGKTIQAVYDGGASRWRLVTAA